MSASDSTSVPTLPLVRAVVRALDDDASTVQETIASLAAQDYPALEVLVVGTQEQLDLEIGYAAIALPPSVSLPTAFNQGAAHDGLAVADYLLFCHDDVVLAPSAVRHMVEQVFRVNAGVVGPKYVDSADPEFITSLGEITDDLGFRAPRVDAGELDQQQHDGAREVPSLLSGALLVRRDLFDALGGFDPGIDGYGEDYDLCRRARYLGARIAVAPLARVAHHQLTASGQRQVSGPTPRSRRLANQIRTFSVVNDGPLAAVRTLKFLAVIALLFVVAIARRDALTRRELWTVVAGRRAQRADIRRRRALLHRGARSVAGSAKRSELARANRVVSVSTWRMIAPELRIWSDRTDRDQPIGSDEFAQSVHEITDRVQKGSQNRDRNIARLVLAAIAALQILGSRDLIAGGVAQLGTIATLPESIPQLLQASWFTAQDPLLSGNGAASPVLLLLAPVIALFGGAATAITVVALLVAGPIGARRLAKHVVSPTAALIVAGAYALVPVGYNAINQGSLLTLVAYGLLPFFVLFVCASSNTQSSARLAGFGLWAIAIVGISPTAALPLGVVVASLWLTTSTVATNIKTTLCDVVTYAVAATASTLVLGAWIGSGVGTGGLRELVLGSQRADGAANSIGELLRLSVGSVNASSTIAVLLIVAGLAGLIVGQDERFRVAGVLWMWTVSSLILVVGVQRGYLPVGTETTAILLAFAGVGVALLVGVAHDAFTRDVLGTNFGTRHLIALGAFGAALLAMLPTLGAVTDGRWYSPTSTIADSLQWMPDADADGAYRVLYLGDPTVLPAMSGGQRQLEPGFGFAVSINGPSSAAQTMTLRSTQQVTAIAQALDDTRQGLSRQLGQQLAELNIRYVVVLRGEGVNGNGPIAITPDGLSESLDTQVDLIALQRQPVADVFLNAAWGLGNRASITSPTTAWYRIASAGTFGIVALLMIVVARGRRDVVAGEGQDSSALALAETPVAVDTDIDLRPDVVHVIDDTVRVDDKGAE